MEGDEYLPHELSNEPFMVQHEFAEGNEPSTVKVTSCYLSIEFYAFF